MGLGLKKLGFVYAGIFAAAVLLLAACGGDGDDPVTPAAQAATESNAVAGSEFPDVVPLEEPLEAPAGVPEELATVWEVWNLLTRDHVDRSNFDPEIFTEAAIRGLLEALDDPHTNYVTASAFQIDNEDLLGRFEGIGATVSMRRDGKLQVVAPLDGSPAKAAGLKPGDVILEVDGESIEGLGLLDAVSKIRGPRGSEVVLLVLHLGSIDPVQLTVRRDVIPLHSVLLRSEPGDRIAHIRLTTFYADTAEVLARTIVEARGNGAEGLIIDVRDNPGGLLDAAIAVTSQFLEDGLVAYEIDGRGTRKNLPVRDGGVATDMPLVILTNEFSASASEILVGALQDRQRATVIGGTTFGKGVVNILRRLSNDGGLYVTVAKWFTPDGRLIQGEGLVPDIEVTSRDRQQAETDQLQRAIDFLEAELGTRESKRAP